jgi:hypothetical protein
MASPAAAETSLSGLVYSRVNVDFRHDKSSPFEDDQEWRNKLFVELKADPKENVAATFSLLAEHDTLAGLDTRVNYRLGLYEAYARVRSGDWDVFVGKQTVDWGKADVSLIDTVNPRNLEEFAGREDEFLKIPTLLGRVVYTRNADTFEALYQPFYTPSQLSLNGTDWSLLSSNTLGQYHGDIDVGLYAKQGFKPGVDDYPTANAVNGNVGLRWNHQGENFDYQLTYVNGWAVLPLFDFNKDFGAYLAAQPEGARKTLYTLTPQELLAFSPLYKSRPARQNQVGFGTSGYLGESTVRAELTAIHPQELYTSDFALTRHTVAAGTVGIDRFVAGNLYVNASYLGAFVGQYPKQGLYLLREWNHFGVLLVRDTFFDERFAPELRAVANAYADHGRLKAGFMLNPRLPIKVAENTLLVPGAYWLNGPGQNLFGQFNDNSYAFLQLRRAF